MKNLLIIILLVPILAQSQNLKYSASFAPNLSGYTKGWFQKGKPALRFLDFGVSSGFLTEYYFPKTFSVGSSLIYVLTRAKLYTPCNCVHPADRTVSIRNQILTHSIDVPVFLKIRTNKNENSFTYLDVGVGLDWLFHAYRIVENEVNFLHTYPDPIRTEITKESFVIENSKKNPFGTFFQIGIGQTFQIKQDNLFAEVYYRQDINSWVYKTYETPDGIKEFPIKRQGIFFKIGYAFHKRTEKE